MCMQCCSFWLQTDMLYIMLYELINVALHHINANTYILSRAKAFEVRRSPPHWAVQGLA